MTHSYSPLPSLGPTPVYIRCVISSQSGTIYFKHLISPRTERLYISSSLWEHRAFYSINFRSKLLETLHYVNMTGAGRKADPYQWQTPWRWQWLDRLCCVCEGMPPLKADCADREDSGALGFCQSKYVAALGKLALIWLKDTVLISSNSSCWR